MFQVILGPPLWSTEAVAAVQLWSAFLADVCVQTSTAGSLSVRIIPPYSCNCGALWWCALLYYFSAHACCPAALCFFRRISQPSVALHLWLLCIVYVCCMLWCNILFKGNGKYGKRRKESANVHPQTWIAIFFFWVYKKDLAVFSLQDGNYASIEVRSHPPLSSSILCKLGTMEALAISNKTLVNVKAIIFQERWS